MVGDFDRITRSSPNMQYTCIIRSSPESDLPEKKKADKKPAQSPRRGSMAGFFDIS
jgi:hypothetical protein